MKNRQQPDSRLDSGLWYSVRVRHSEMACRLEAATVAQVSNLLYRGLPARRARLSPKVTILKSRSRKPDSRLDSGLWYSVRVRGSEMACRLEAATVAQVSPDLSGYRGLPARKTWPSPKIAKLKSRQRKPNTCFGPQTFVLSMHPWQRNAPPAGSRRYSRLEVCATTLRRCSNARLRDDHRAGLSQGYFGYNAPRANVPHHSESNDHRLRVARIVHRATPGFVSPATK